MFHQSGEHGRESSFIFGSYCLYQPLELRCFIFSHWLLNNSKVINFSDPTTLKENIISTRNLSSLLDTSLLTVDLEFQSKNKMFRLQKLIHNCLMNYCCEFLNLKQRNTQILFYGTISINTSKKFIMIPSHVWLITNVSKQQYWNWSLVVMESLFNHWNWVISWLDCVQFISFYIDWVLWDIPRCRRTLFFLWSLRCQYLSLQRWVLHENLCVNLMKHHKIGKSAFNCLKKE